MITRLKHNVNNIFMDLAYSINSDLGGNIFNHENS